jgi:chemotaxis protein methyltransferase CheR
VRAADFHFVAELVNRRSGMVLPADKFPLAESRLWPVARRFGFRDLEAMRAELRHAPESLASAVVEALAIHDTSFFRDRSVFEHFRNAILPPLLETRMRARRLRLWCAGASTGQEPYSLAMMLAEIDLSGWHVELIATDLSQAAIACGREGVYSQAEVKRGLRPREIAKHFVPEGEGWRIAERIRRMVTFRAFNLLDDCGWLGELDVIFCRNVLMYFDPRSKAAVLQKLAAALAPGGCLLLGASETAQAAMDWLEPEDAARGLYRKLARRPRLRLLAG